jgi:hypothetical protein
MSDSLALAAVTSGLTAMISDFISESAGGTVPGAEVTHQEPDAAELMTGEPFVNVFLYRVSRNASLQNADLPTRSADGARLRAPVASVDLSYMISFYGDQATLEPQRLMGSVVAGLHAQPRLPRSYIEAAIKDNTWLAGADLGDDGEVVFTDVPTDRDDISRIWREFPRASYQLSAFYEASVVRLQSGVEPGRALPVRAISLQPRPQAPIRILSVENAARDQPLTAGSVLLIRGEALPGPDAAVLVDGVPAARLRSSTPRRIELELTRDVVPSLRAGAVPIQVLAPSGGPGGGPRPASQPQLALIRPRQRGRPQWATGWVTVEIDPPLAPGQAAVLLLNRFGEPLAEGLSYDAPALDQPASSITFAVADATPGDYLAQVVVEGLASPLEFDGRRWSGPLLTIPAAEA